MRYSQVFWKTYHQTPSEAENISAALLVKGAYIDRVGAGLYSLLPLGLKVHKKIESIIRQNLDEIGCEEVLLPALHPAEVWQKTGRLKTMEPPLFTTKDRKNQTLVLASTHEEVITQLVGKFTLSYSDLPRCVYQIQTKFRNEIRPTGGLLRTREFSMLDAYSFHESVKDLEDFYKKITTAFEKIFTQCGFQTVTVVAQSGSMGGAISHEILLLAETGEDRVLICSQCQKGWKKEVFKEKNCPSCKVVLKEERAIESGHVFQLGDLYSKKLDMDFVDKDNKRKPAIMGCYGIGIGRLLASAVEANHDEYGIIWPKSIAPYQVYLVGLTSGADKIYEKLSQAKVEVFYDDRRESAGVKFADADLLGFPIRLVVSEKTQKEGKVEVKIRGNSKTEMVAVDKLVDYIKNMCYN